MKPNNDSIIWASSRFGANGTTVSETPIKPTPQSISVAGFLKNLIAIRLLLNASEFAEARRTVELTGNSQLDLIPVIMIAVLAELQVAIEVHDGNYEQAINLYEQLIIPAYAGLPRVLINRARSSLDVLNNHVQKAS